tara:strand:+ start:32 stop:1045 length:1014 start_codon:yes stop_codon:yes gene_type:complete
MIDLNGGQFPEIRLRRNRTDKFSRALVRENVLLPSNLILPIFLKDSLTKREAIKSLPDIYRFNIDEALLHGEEALKLNIPAVALFPCVPSSKKSFNGSEAFNEEGLIQKAIKLFKKNLPELGLVTDIALDPFTIHGQDGIIDDDGYVLNDETVKVLVRQALSHAEAGADIVAPSDMMDGRIGAIRYALEKKGFPNTRILSYSAKYASNLYGPFREAVNSNKKLEKIDKASYQMDPSNIRESLREVWQDLQEGADMVLVKPALPYLDVVSSIKSNFKVPVGAYQVSGEYAMIKAAGQRGLLNEHEVMHECLISCVRAGADFVFSYGALEIAKQLKSGA